MSRYSIKNAKKVARESGGDCLSDEYAHLATAYDKKLRWRCKLGHEWVTDPKSVVYNGTWCPTCNLKVSNIEEMQEVAKSKEGKCLSDKYINSNSKLRWECREGHKWFAVPSSIIHHGTWCPYCAGKILTLADLKRVALERGGKCLSMKYEGANAKYEWECSEGHKWLATGSSVKNRTWCLKCAKKRNAKNERLETLKRVIQIAKSKGGKCLSTIEGYNRSGCPVKLRCHQGHEWSVQPLSIVNRGYWCPQCYVPPLKRTFEEMHELASKHGGKCLSEEYIASHKPLLWRCSEGHEFQISPQKIINRGKWCYECKHQEISINDAINMARELGGACLSSSVKSTRSPLTWECKEGHQWRSSYLNAKEKWCRECAVLTANVSIKYAA